VGPPAVTSGPPSGLPLLAQTSSYATAQRQSLALRYWNRSSRTPGGNCWQGIGSTNIFVHRQATDRKKQRIYS